MSGLSRKHTERPDRRRPRVSYNPMVALAAAAVLVAGLVGATTGMTNAALSTTIPSTFFTVLDQQGANDVPAQSDITQMGRDESASGVYKLFWSWDSTDQWTSSGQTGDACSLFDYGTDGKVDAAVCGQVHNNPAKPSEVVLNHAPFVFRCSNAKTDRCAQPSPEVSYASTDIAAGELGNPQPATKGSGGSQVDLVTATDPFGGGATNGPGSNHPNDATLQVNISKTYLNGLSSSGVAKLVNVCSFPSAGNGGNNNPFDCVVAPGSGFLKIVKNASEDRSWTFGVSPTPAGQPTAYTFATSTPVTGGFTGSSPNAGRAIDATVTVTETAVSSWSLSNATCTKAGGGTTGTRSGLAVSGIAIESGLLTTCTFTNVRDAGSIMIQKTDGSNALGGAAFTAQLGSATPVTIPAVQGQTGLFCLDGLPTGGTYAIVESTTPTGYNGAAVPSVTVSTTSTCAGRLADTSNTVDRTVANSRKVGSIAIQKVKGDGTTPLGGAAFSVTKVSGDGATGAQTVPAVANSTGLFCIAGLPAGGVYSIQETTTPAGYNTATTIPNVTVVESTCADAATRTTGKATVTNNPAAGTINIKKVDDQATTPRTPLAGAVFTLYQDTNGDLQWQTSETTTQGTAQTTSGTGSASFGSVPLGKYCVVETGTPAGYATAAPQCLEVALGTAVSTGQTYELTFEDPRLHKVLVIVCHEGTDKLDPSSVTLGTGAGATTTSLAAAQLPAGWTEAQVCGLPGASYGGLGHGTVSPSVTPH